MNTRKQLVILAVLIFSSLLLIGGAATVSLHHYQMEHEDTIVMTDIETTLFERRLATDAYQVSESEAERQNWVYLQSKLDHLLSTDVIFDASDQKALQMQIQGNFKKSKQLFGELTTLLEESKKGVAISEVAKNAIKVQMNATTKATAEQVSALSKSILAEEAAAFSIIIGVTGGGLLYFLLLLLFAMWMIRKSLSAIEGKEIELENILNALPVGVFLASYPEGRPLLVNKAGIAMLGKGVDLRATKNNYSDIYSIVTADDAPYPSEDLPLSIVLSTGKAVTKKEIFIKRLDGNKIALQVTAVPLMDNAGKILEAFAVFSDITKEREVDKMKNEFISLASHQLRTPLSATKWFLEMLMKGDAGKLTKKQMKYVVHVNESNERMIELVGALLNVSRIESGRIIVEPSPTDIKSLITTIVTDMKKMFAEKKQQLVIDVAKNLPKISIDKKLVRQVYMNLLTNANKYTPDNGKITIRVVKQDEKLLSEISDNGYGIPKEERNKVFQKFYRGANILSAVPTGTGLGLYLVKAIIESSNGKIWFESEENKGTIFTFTLPLSGMTKKKGEVSLD